MFVDEIDEALEPPERKDFRRVGRGVPYVMVDGKRQRYSRFSNAGKILDDESALTDWRIRTILMGAAYRPELMAMVATLDAQTDKKRIRDIAEECLIAGKGMQRNITGTAVHSMLDHHDNDDGWQAPSHFADAVKAYADACALYGLVPIDIECHCVNDELRLAGTMDRRYRLTRALIAPDLSTLPIGAVVVGDTKTGATLEYAQGSYCTQEAGYATSVRYDVLTDERSEFDPPTNRDWGLIMHVVAEGDVRCDVYFVDLQKGMEGLRLAQQVKAWRRQTDLLMPALPPSWPVAVPDALPALRQATPEPPDSALEAPVSDAPHAQRWKWLRARVEVIQAHPDALAQLLRSWPDGVPGLKQCVHSFADLAAIEHVCNEVEKEHSLPFPTRDPVDVEREALIDKWLDDAQCDRRSLVGQSLVAFATLVGQYTVLEVSELLHAAMRGIGVRFLRDLTNDDADMMHRALSLVMGDAYSLRYIDGEPVMFAVSENLANSEGEGK